MDTVYSIQVILIKLAVAIAFCIADYKGNKEADRHFISTAIAEKLSALMTENYLKERSEKGSGLKHEGILAKVPDGEPELCDTVRTV